MPFGGRFTGGLRAMPAVFTTPRASEHAGDGIVGVAGASVVRQCLNAGILDAVRVSHVPYLIGEGISYFAGLEGTPVTLGQPKVVEARASPTSTTRSSASYPSIEPSARRQTSAANVGVGDAVWTVLDALTRWLR
jgi:dihydrofolate reductase